ncbi:MAG TPA: triose-phosphate isomerase [Sporichthya sp.]|nr:triose-phosphate isomerase [Sporichthya sp.]
MAKDPEGRTPLMAGNWKMNLNHLEANALTTKLGHSLDDADFGKVEVALLVPFTDIRTVQTVVDGEKMRFAYGAQDISAFDSGAYTGEVSGAMLAKLGCTYAIVGHSERRQYHAEDDATVNAKLKATFRHGLRPILCIGEKLELRQSGGHVTHCMSQLDNALDGIPAKDASDLVIAYEPVWAIGTGEVATPEDAQEVCGAVRSRLAELYSKELADAVRVLYGGSVKGDNVVAIMSQPDVDGALVGGASLQAEEFTKIVRYYRG